MTEPTKTQTELDWNTGKGISNEKEKDSEKDIEKEKEKEKDIENASGRFGLQPTALTAADDLVHSLRLLTTPSGPATAPLDDAIPLDHPHPHPHPHSLHPSARIHPLSLALHNLATAKQAIAHSLSRISNALEHFNQATAFHLNSHFNQHLQLNNLANPNTIQIIKLFAILRESATHQASLIHNTRLAQNQLEFSDHALAQRPTFLSPSLLIDSLPHDQRFPSSLPLIEAVARELGLECFRDSEDANLLMIAGKLMLIDIEIDPCNAGRVRRCRFSYSFGDDEARRDEAVDGELCQQLADVHLAFRDSDSARYDLDALARVRRALEGFACSLRRLKALDELVDRQREPHEPAGEPVDYFLHLRRLIVAYHAHVAAHPSAGSGSNPAGVALSAPTEYQLRLAYHSPAHALDAHSPHALTLSVAFTPSAELHLHHPLPLPSQPGSESLFTAILRPPIPISRVSAECLLKLSTGSQNLDLLPLSIDRTQPARRRGVRLEDLLVEHTLKDGTTDLDYHDPDWKVRRFGIKFKGQRQRFVFSFLREEGEGVELEDGPDSSDGLGYLLERVQFGDLERLLSIIAVCRRQAVLNELFESCFSPHTYLRRSAAGAGAPADPFVGGSPASVAVAVEQRHRAPLTLASLLSDSAPADLAVDIALSHRSYTLTAQLTSPSPHGWLVSIALRVGPDACIHASCTVERGADRRVSEALKETQSRLERVVQETRKVPVALRCLVKILEDSAGVVGSGGEDEDRMVVQS